MITAATSQMTTGLRDKGINNALSSQDSLENAALAAQEARLQEEVERLLATAQRDLDGVKVVPAHTQYVDAHELLLDVEAEVDPETFKDKIFRTLKKGFNEVVEAVADRNQ